MVLSRFCQTLMRLVKVARNCKCHCGGNDHRHTDMFGAEITSYLQIKMIAHLLIGHTRYGAHNPFPQETEFVCSVHAGSNRLNVYK